MSLKSLKNTLLAGFIICLFYACATIPKGAQAVDNFKKEKYLGTWYEIARMDFRFERNLNNTTAQYSLNENGTIRVYNRGYNYVKGKWEDATGKAKFVKGDSIGMLKVSFFGPFYAGYNVIAIDADYQYALVAGKNLDYLWILSREKSIPEDVKIKYLDIAKDLGYHINDLTWVEQQKSDQP